jgi:hypothetical protein
LANGPEPCGTFRKTELRSHRHHQHHDRVRRVGWNAMKPRFHCVLAHWNPGSTASGSGPIFMIDIAWRRIRCEARLASPTSLMNPIRNNGSGDHWAVENPWPCAAF